MARTILVTGAESGIGSACAAAFGALGDRVAIGYYADPALADITCQAVINAGGEAVAIHCDVGDEGAVGAAFDALERHWGPADVMINSAGVNMSGVPVRDMKLAQWQRLIAI